MKTKRDRRQTPRSTSLAPGDHKSQKSILDLWSSDAAPPDGVGNTDTASVKVDDRKLSRTTLNGEGKSKDNARIISKKEKRKKSKNNHRVPVLNPDGTPAMPTTNRRANKWLKEKKAKIVRNDLGIFQIQLLKEPSGRNKQPIISAIDPGSAFTGIGIISKNSILYGAMLELPGYKKGSKPKVVKNRFGKKIQKFPNTIVEGMDKRRELRRGRRYRKTRRRPSRFLNRSKSKIPPSILSRKQLELRIVKELSKIYPISMNIYEDVKYNHFKDTKGTKGQFFSHVEVGKNWILDRLKEIAPLRKIKGYETNIRRRQLNLKKEDDKTKRIPESHVNDCISMGSIILGLGIETKNKFKFDVITRPKYSRRFLHLEQFSKKGIRRRYGGTTIDWTNVRKGDYVEAIQGKNVFRSYVSGFTTMNDRNYIYVSDFDWNGFGKNGTQTAIIPSNIRIINRKNGLLLHSMVKVMTREELFSQKSGTFQMSDNNVGW